MSEKTPSGVEPIIVSFSEVSTMRQCLYKHELAYRLRWQTDQIGPALATGIDWHQIMETHYRILMVIQQEQREGVVAINAQTDAERIWEAIHPLLYSTLTGQQSERQALLEWMYRGHIEAYGLDPQWDIIAVEHAPQMWLPGPSGRRSKFKIKMKIDLVVRDRKTGLVWIVDHKSSKDLPKDKEFDLDDQFGLYEWGLETLGTPVHGTIHSAARTYRYKTEGKPQPIEERFKRHRMTRTRAELDTIALEAYRQVKIAYGQKIGEAPRSPNPDTCRYRCDFTDACLLARKGVPIEGTLLGSGFVQDFSRH